MARAENRRTRLREFQESLAERLAQAKNTPATASRLGFTINDARWLVELSEAGEIVPMQDITPVPLTHQWFRGLTNIRGVLVTVVDLSLFMGGPQTRIDRESRVLSFAPSLEFNAGILVTRMLGLHNVNPWQQQAPQNIQSDWVTCSWHDGRSTWHEANLGALALDEQFLKISPL